MDIDNFDSIGFLIVEWFTVNFALSVFIFLSASYLLFYMLFRFGKFKVERVIDGDTVRLKGEKVNSRLHGIDAPESKQRCGKESTEYLKKLVEGKYCKIVAIKKCKYGRDVVKLYRWGDIQKKMVKAGYAVPYMSKEYESFRRKVKFKNPSEFRKGK